MYVNYVGSLVNQTTPFPITELKGVSHVTKLVVAWGLYSANKVK